MAIGNFYNALQSDLQTLDASYASKRCEKVIEGFSSDNKAIISGKPFLVFNSNDYLGLRYHSELQEAEAQASRRFGTGPGAVRFISGTTKMHADLEIRLSLFHSRERAIIFSSAFSANTAILSALIRPPTNAQLSENVLVISDELNHRSIIDGIRMSGAKAEQKVIYSHLAYDELEHKLESNTSVFDRVIVVTDGIFSMLGEHADLAKIRTIIKKHDAHYKQGVLLIVDDSHGVGVYGKTGRGCEEVCNVQADILIGTLGKAFGADGGYAVGKGVLVDYLREYASHYIYSNSIAPGTAAAAHAAVEIVDSSEGMELLKKLNENISYFKKSVFAAGLTLASASSHPIQPVLVGDTQKTRDLTKFLFNKQILATPINYPIVPHGRDEIRFQLSATHNLQDIDGVIKECIEYFKRV